MSLQQIFKCASIGCQNNVFKKQSPQSRKRFCRDCLSRDSAGTILKWKCQKCDAILSDQNLKKNTCDSCKHKRRLDYSKQYNAGMKIIKRSRRLQNKRCHCCFGRFVGYGVFCTEYCKWITRMRQRNYGAVLRLEDLK